MLIDPPGLNGRELGQRVIEGKIALLLVHVLIRGHGAVEHVGLEAGIGVQGALTVSALLALVAVTQTATHREDGGDLVRHFHRHVFGHIRIIPFQVDRSHKIVLHFKFFGRCGSKWRTGGPRHREASGHRDQKQGRGHTKTPAQHGAMRTHEKLLHLMYWLISCL